MARKGNRGARDGELGRKQMVFDLGTTMPPPEERSRQSHLAKIDKLSDRFLDCADDTLDLVKVEAGNPARRGALVKQALGLAAGYERLRKCREAYLEKKG